MRICTSMKFDTNIDQSITCHGPTGLQCISASRLAIRMHNNNMSRNQPNLRNLNNNNNNSNNNNYY